MRKSSDGRDIDNDMALENSLTNMLVKYLRKHRTNTKFKLELLTFEAETAEIDDNTNKTLGFIDIKVGNVTLKFSGNAEESIYYAFECKRLNDSNYASYIDEGILRFIYGKYSKNMSFAGMIGYFEITGHDIENIVKKINTNLDNKFKKGKLDKKCSLNKYEIQDDFENSYISNHERKKTHSIDLYHLILDYSNIIDS